MRHTIKWSFAAVVVAAAGLLGMVGAASAAQPKSLMVCSSGCQFTTIAAALNAAPSGSKITVGPGTYGGGFVIDKKLNLVGAGADQTTISGGGMVVTVASGVSTTIRAATITGGHPDWSAGTPGGGILNNGVLTLRDSAIANNSTLDDGGGIYNNDNLTLIRTVVRNNTTGGSYNRGGGLYNRGKVVLNNSSVEENWGFIGGGIYNAGGTATVTNSSVSGNGGCAGPGILNETGTMVIKGSTLSNNTGFDDGKCGVGGAIANYDNLTVVKSTISNNRAPRGGGLYNRGTLMLTSSSVEGNTGNYGGSFPNNSGGGIFNAGQLTLRATFITNNTRLPGGDGDGGGIFNTDPGTVTIHGGAITGNTPNDCVGC